VNFSHASSLKSRKHITATNYLIHDPIIDTSGYNVTTQFDEAFTKIVELSHQMVYPSDWRIG
ncbi:hypothetical protein, partial [Xenorhabdus bovienii]|uniref:hypothetical protein n=1 Tax=Xenorhabdus bovienii TaxID=40576 RepID=UPI001E46E2C7